MNIECRWRYVHEVGADSGTFMRLVWMVVCLGRTCSNYGVLNGHAHKYGVPDGNAACRYVMLTEKTSHASKQSDAWDAVGVRREKLIFFTYRLVMFVTHIKYAISSMY